ncbi:MAG: hypothetical protein LUO95_08690 [Methylococcaceae bacterium]|nr:hypothetical protein [Methylococcaceae bacterium]MDD1616718.1 hypothetical protein [Methylococcaceae bacterium]OYV16988.1 MAG: hypothetical protein CG439_1867 [Methylococcaceae bacterium NSP1-2]
MLKLNQFVFLLVIGLAWQNVYAEDDIISALQKTQDCLRNQTCEAAKSNAGQAADQKALAAVGGNTSNEQELYNISADIMPMLIQQTGGDSEKMQALLLKAQTDPQGFLNSLPPDIQTKIKNLANAVEKK